MADDIIRIFAEDIDFEQWQILLRFSYTDSIEHMLKQKELKHDDSTVEHISGCMIQAQEYFSAAGTATLNISPLLYYYGLTNLIHGVMGLTCGSSKKPIKDHGLKFRVCDDHQKIGDLLATVTWNSEGAFRYFSEYLVPDIKLKNGDQFPLVELLASIPELRHDFQACYTDQPKTILLESVADENGHFERISVDEINRFSHGIDVLRSVTDFDKCYLRQNSSGDYWVLKPKPLGQEIGKYAISGQKYLQISHQLKENRTVVFHPILYYLMGMFILGMVCRYRPDLWLPFVRSNQGLERHFIGRFVRTARRIVPNLALNVLFGKRVCLSNIPEGTMNLSKPVSRDDIREMIRNEIHR